MKRIVIRNLIIAGAGALVAPASLAAEPPSHVAEAIALTQVFGDGQRLVGIALRYDQPVAAASLSPTDFHVAGRTVTAVHAATSATMDTLANSGRFVIVELDQTELSASLKIGGPEGGPGSGASPTRRLPPARASAGQRSTNGPGGPGGPGGGPRFAARQIYATPTASIVQSGEIATSDGHRYSASPTTIVTTRAVTPIADQFRQLAFTDAKTGMTLRYNLFVPAGYAPGKHFPLVLFMHDAGVISNDVTTTLKQGLGALSFASPADQAKHPAFVLAPQYADVAVDDRGGNDTQLDTTVDLVEALVQQYGLDRSQLYTTGQSMGAMMSIAIDIKHPDLFAASYIVAGQWDATKVAPLARQKLWILVSQGDERAYPGENAITQALDADGAKVARAVWDGTADQKQLATDVAALEVTGAPINYVALRKGTVVPPTQTDNPATNHINTWRIAYSIPGIRDWLFKQKR